MTLEEIEDLANKKISRRVNRFANLVKKELNIDIKSISREDLRKVSRKLTKLAKKAKMDDIATILLNLTSDIDKTSTKQLSRDLNLSVSELNEEAINKASILADLELEKDLNFINEATNKRIRKGLTIRTIKKMTKEQLSKHIDNLLEPTKSMLESASRTAIMGYDRSVTTAKANNVGANKFKYTGQNDSKTRKFCKDRVGKVFTDEQAERWNNGQKKPASVYLGGYNCRHRKVYQLD